MRSLARRRIPPMPIEDIVDHPRALTLPAAGFGMLNRLCYHFWVLECKMGKLTDDDAFCIVRAHRPTWNHHRFEILSIFTDIRPRLEAHWKARQASHDLLSSLRARRTANDRRKKVLLQQAPAPVVALVPKHGQVRKERLSKGEGSSFYAPAKPADTEGLFRDV